MNGFNNNFNGYPTGGYYGGYMYQEAPKTLNMTQGLKPEQIQSLRKTGGFSLDIPEEEMFRAWCTHRYENKFAVTQDDEGNYVCSLCGTKFKPFEGEVSDARDVVEKVIDLLETTKMQSLTLPPKTIQDFFQIEPVLKRLPELYSQSRNDYKRALGMNDNYVYGQENNAFMMYQNMINPMANNYYDPAVMQPYGSQPMVGSQPMYVQPQNFQQPMMYNGGGYPQQGYQPYGQGQMDMQQQQNPFNSNPTPVNNAAQPQQNNNTADTVTVTKTMTD